MVHRSPVAGWLAADDDDALHARARESGPGATRYTIAITRKGTTMGDTKNLTHKEEMLKEEQGTDFRGG